MVLKPELQVGFCSSSLSSRILFLFLLLSLLGYVESVEAYVGEEYVGRKLGERVCVVMTYWVNFARVFSIFSPVSPVCLLPVCN